MRRMLTSKLWTYRLLRILLLIVAAVFVLHTLMQTINFLLWPSSPGFVELSNRFDMDDEASIPTWVAQFLLTIGAIFAFIAARFSTGKRRIGMYIMGSLVLLAALDEIARLHELAVQTLHYRYFGENSATLWQNGWILLLPFILFLGIAIIITMLKTLPKRTITLLVYAGSIYFAGAFGVELFSSGMNTQSLVYTTLVTGIEEGLEFVGIVLFIFAMTDYIQKYHQQHFKDILAKLSIKA